MCSKLNASQRNWIFYGFCSIPLVLGTCSLVLGIWLCVVVVHNGKLPKEQQVQFEKVISPWSGDYSERNHDVGGVSHLDNESPFTHTSIDNLSLYLLSLSFVTVFGGSGRLIGTTFFCLHFIHNRVTGQLFWAWLALSILAVAIEVLVAYDILHTLSHNDVAPPYNRDFYFTNDSNGFYSLCQTLRYFIWVDLALSGLGQLLLCWLFRVQVVDNE